jgi:hypothetical protein
MRIKLHAWWTGCEQITDRFKKQFIGSYFNSDEHTIVTDDTYDVAVVFGFTKEALKTDKNHTIYFFQEPYWSNNWDREAYKKSNHVYCPSKELYGNYEEFKVDRTYMFYGGHGDVNFDIDTVLNYNNTNKSKNLSTVVTNRSYSPLTGCNTHSIYDKRVKLTELCIEQGVDIDVFGAFWEDSQLASDSRVKGNIYTKFLALDDYRFSIAIENSNIDNYITEKLYDVIFFNALPVYCGAPNISQYTDLYEYIIPLDLSNTEQCISTIKSLNKDLYYEKTKNVNEFKYNILSSSKYNIWKKIINIVNNI